LDDGKDVEIQRVSMVGGDKPKGKDIIIENPPEVEKYDALIFGSPVHAFALSLAMKTYLEEIPSLHGKKIALFVTKGTRFNWTGGNQAINKMKKICQSKGGTIIGTGIVIWNKQRHEKIAELAREFSGLF
ncbi:MAG: flavodoxin, partial [Euryarchaeota archaeon]|nr:flavodoxin [Euryarchaeota archaeon]